MPPPTCARGDLCLSFLFITPFRRRRGGTNKPGPRLRALNARVSPSARFATGVRTVVEWCGLPHAAARAVGYGGPKQRAPRPAHPPVGPGVARGRFALKIAPGPGPVGGGSPALREQRGLGIAAPVVPHAVWNVRAVPPGPQVLLRIAHQYKQSTITRLGPGRAGPRGSGHWGEGGGRGRGAEGRKRKGEERGGRREPLSLSLSFSRSLPSVRPSFSLSLSPVLDPRVRDRQAGGSAPPPARAGGAGEGGAGTVRGSRIGPSRCSGWWTL